MKRFAILLILIAAAAIAHAAKKFTIDDLKQTLVALQQGGKTDQDIATRLKEIELSEQLTASTRESLKQLAPGPLAGEQFDILEGRAAVLVPPHTELPDTAAPDVATQKAILAKAVDYVTKVYMQSPHLLVSRATSRYQDGVESIHTNSGVANNMPGAGGTFTVPNMTMRLIGAHTDTVETDKGLELIQQVKQKQPWGQNGQISEGGPGPVLSVILQEAAAAGTLNWRRWTASRGIFLRCSQKEVALRGSLLLLPHHGGHRALGVRKYRSEPAVQHLLEGLQIGRRLPWRVFRRAGDWRYRTRGDAGRA